MRYGEAVGVMHGPRSERAASRAWSRLRRPCNGWKCKPRRQRRPNSRAAAEAERRRTGQKRRGQVPQPVVDTPDDKAQRNLTDPELHIMRTNNKGWDDCGNAPASGDGACQIILARAVTDATNDKEQAEPLAQAPLATLAQAGIESPKNESGAVQAIPATLALHQHSCHQPQSHPVWL